MGDKIDRIFKQDDPVDHIFLQFINRAQDPLLVDNFKEASLESCDFWCTNLKNSNFDKFQIVESVWL